MFLSIPRKLQIQDYSFKKTGASESWRLRYTALNSLHGEKQKISSFLWNLSVLSDKMQSRGWRNNCQKEAIFCPQIRKWIWIPRYTAQCPDPNTVLSHSHMSKSILCWSQKALRPSALAVFEFQITSCTGAWLVVAEQAGDANTPTAALLDCSVLSWMAVLTVVTGS